ncbi:MAG: pilus assembly protein TadG-related protein [Actinomycetota bacterium]|nr:pilus assembly protein TadG-related protein [Actinomycetota bacterium]
MNERGQTTVLVLGMALLAFAVAGLAVDGTRAWLWRRTLQNAADAAALAGAGELDRAAYYGSGGRDVALNEGSSERVAAQWLARRTLDATARVDASAERVTVELRGSVPTTFLSIAGIRTIPVAVRADAAPTPGTP